MKHFTHYQQRTHVHATTVVGEFCKRVDGYHYCISPQTFPGIKLDTCTCGLFVPDVCLLAFRRVLVSSTVRPPLIHSRSKVLTAR